MGTFYHKLKRNETNQTPRNWIFVDTEADRHIYDDGTEYQTLRFGAAVYSRPSKGRSPPFRRWKIFDEAGEFWDWVLSIAEPDRPAYICAYNMGYDCRMLNAVHELEQRGYEQRGIYVSQAAFLFSFQKDKHKLTLIDAMNWLDGSLESWSKLVGLPKFEDYLDAEDETYFVSACCRDVEILEAVVQQWFDFRYDHDLGVFKPTKAGQAMAAFQHRFMDRTIYIHANDEALDLERDGYHGGRCEAWHIGCRDDGPFHLVDVNSLYPYIMRTTPVPIRLWTLTSVPGIEWIDELRDRFGMIARVTVDTDEPIYPIRHDGKLIWPIGRFITTLPKPELLEAVDRGHVACMHELTYYDEAVVFDKFVDELYDLRYYHKHNGNTIYEQLVKYLLNSLYGKFGQYSEDWVQFTPDEFMEQGYNQVVNYDKGTMNAAYVIGRMGWEVVGRKEARDAFPAISATITSAARMHLWQMIETAGKDHVYYMDTDSLLVDQAGLDNLTDWLDDSTLGMLELQQTTSWFDIISAKDYRTASTGKTKGVPSHATLGDDGAWHYPQMEGFRGAINADRLDGVAVKTATKRRQSHYSKGQVSSDGSVSPLKLCEA